MPQIREFNEKDVVKIAVVERHKGTGFIDCDLWVSQSGNYSCGVSTLQCMYAPEFTATAMSQQLNTGK